MSEAELNVLERDVEQARERFAGDLARLRSPATLSNFQNDLWAQASETKDDLVEKAKEAATDGVQRLVSDLKDKAAANPAAALAIGAGLAWRLVHRPPIASLLVGIGLFNLWRTSPPPEGEGLLPRAAEVAGQVKETVQVACTRFRRHRVRCFDGAGGGSWRDGSLRGSSSLRRCA